MDEQYVEDFRKRAEKVASFLCTEGLRIVSNDFVKKDTPPFLYHYHLSRLFNEARNQKQNTAFLEGIIGDALLPHLKEILKKTAKLYENMAVFEDMGNQFGASGYYWKREEDARRILQAFEHDRPIATYLRAFIQQSA